ncbi:MAG: polysaccharide deacetylase [Myxococcales bacterium]|nr:polysaccharide deacetylase [Myxococcales bacterium]
MSGRRLASVSVDLDPLSCYYRIHALGPAPAELSATIFRRAVPRFLDVFARNGVRATFFVVGADLADPAVRRLARELVAAGHELGNHSHTHPYELARLPRERVAEEIDAAHAAIGDAAGVAPVGFRAPGYDLSQVMLGELARVGYRYDSSIFPAPAYYAAKAVVMAGLGLIGRPSGAVMTDPRALIAPADPYRPDARRPWRRGRAPLVELPIAVTPWLRLPAIGTNLLLLPAPLRAQLVRSMLGRPHFNLELHGIDLCDAELDGIPAVLVARQPDLRATLLEKQRAFEALLGRIALDYDVLPLRDVAARVDASGELASPDAD